VSMVVGGGLGQLLRLQGKKREVRQPGIRRRSKRGGAHQKGVVDGDGSSKIVGLERPPAVGVDKNGDRVSIGRLWVLTQLIFHVERWRAPTPMVRQTLCSV
jgi:hypothetical protein